MVYYHDLCWRIVSLIHIYNIAVDFLSDSFGPTCCNIHRWYSTFLKNGSARNNSYTIKRFKKFRKLCKCSSHLLHWRAVTTFTINLSWFKKYIRIYHMPCFEFWPPSIPQKLTKAAHEAFPEKIKIYYEKLRPIYSYPELTFHVDIKGGSIGWLLCHDFCNKYTVFLIGKLFSSLQAGCTWQWKVPCQRSKSSALI